MKMFAITLTVIGIFVAPSIGQSSASKGQCLRAEKTCELKCAISSDPENSTCSSVCTVALDTCLGFAEILEPDARGSGKGQRKQSPYASTNNTVLLRD